MGFFGKIKNMFMEEIEEDEPIKKEIIQVKVAAPEPEVRSEKIEERVSRPEPIEEKIEKPIFPTYFDDEDFEVLDINKKEEPKIFRQELKVVRTEPTFKPKADVYAGKKPEVAEKKIFRPTPIISPVYGVLDKNYKKEDITNKKVVSLDYSHDTNINIDDIRKKAYGTLEDELENTLFGRQNVTLTTSIEISDDLYSEPLDLFETSDKKTMDDIDALLNSYTFNDEDNMIEEVLNKNYGMDEYEVKEEKEVDIEKDDLFDLIDSMYSKKDGVWWNS